MSIQREIATHLTAIREHLAGIEKLTGMPPAVPRSGRPGLTYKEAAVRLGLSERTVWQMCKDRRLPRVCVSKFRHFIRLADLEKYLERRTSEMAKSF